MPLTQMYLVRQGILMNSVQSGMLDFIKVVELGLHQEVELQAPIYAGECVTTQTAALLEIVRFLHARGGSREQTAAGMYFIQYKVTTPKPNPSQGGVNKWF